MGFAYEIKLQVEYEIRILMNEKINKPTPNIRWYFFGKRDSYYD